jgi:hypothetical protein
LTSGAFRTGQDEHIGEKGQAAAELVQPDTGLETGLNFSLVAVMSRFSRDMVGAAHMRILTDHDENFI